MQCHAVLGWNQWQRHCCAHAPAHDNDIGWCHLQHLRKETNVLSTCSSFGIQEPLIFGSCLNGLSHFSPSFFGHVSLCIESHSGQSYVPSGKLT
jgi:hypothetical protein